MITICLRCQIAISFDQPTLLFHVQILKYVPLYFSVKYLLFLAVVYASSMSSTMTDFYNFILYKAERVTEFLDDRNYWEPSGTPFSFCRKLIFSIIWMLNITIQQSQIHACCCKAKQYDLAEKWTNSLNWYKEAYSLNLVRKMKIAMNWLEWW